MQLSAAIAVDVLCGAAALEQQVSARASSPACPRRNGALARGAWCIALRSLLCWRKELDALPLRPQKVVARRQSSW